MTGKPTTLGDLAYVFHGAGNADIFTEEKLSKMPKRPDAVECGVIRSPDVMSLSPWHEPSEINRLWVSKRYVSSGSRRGAGQANRLWSNDLLLSTRGIPKVSPMITRQMTEHSAVIAGPEVLVIRAKPGINAAVLREAMKQPAAAEYFAKHTTRKNQDKKPGKGYDKSGVLSKEAVCNLPIPEYLRNARPSFGEEVEIVAHKAESLISGLRPLNHAIVEAARWRAEQHIKPILISRFPHKATSDLSWEKTYEERYNEIQARSKDTHNKVLEDWQKDVSQPMPSWEWTKPYNEEHKALLEEKERWASEGLCRCITALSADEQPSGDAAILCKLLAGTENTKEARRAILSDRDKLESTTLLLQEGDQRASSTKVARSIRSLLASCASNQGAVAVLSAEAGHLANEVMAETKAPGTLALIEDNEPFRNFAKAICELHGKRTRVESVKRAYELPRGLRFDVALMEASGTDVDPKDNEEKVARQSSELFQWHEVGGRIAPGGRMIVHLPTTHWKLLKSVIDNVAMVVQLPPIALPAWSERDPRVYVPCDQGLIVVLKPGSNRTSTFRIIDATRINTGKSAADLTTEQIKRLRSLILEEDSPASADPTTEVQNRELKDLGVWPSIPGFMKKTLSTEDLTKNYTLETMVELFKYRHHLWKRAQTDIFKQVGLPHLF